MEQATWVRHFRTGVLALAGLYWLQQFASNDYSAFGWQFRYLTIWALTFNLVAAGMMYARSTGRTRRKFDAFISVSVVLNGIVVYMYWKLWFTDPALVNGGDPLPWWKEYYLHALGPALQVFDALFILGAFRYMKTVIAWLFVTMLAYIAWIEVLVGPLNDAPVGKVTSGLPYPFLNDMAKPDRMAFYGTVIGLSLLLAAGGWVIVRLVERTGLVRHA